MNIPTWTKPVLQGAVGGMVVLAIVAFSFDWVVTTSEAEKMAREASDQAVVAALGPICEERARQDPKYEIHHAALKEVTAWRRGAELEKYGWATFPGSKNPSRALLNACANALFKS